MLFKYQCEGEKQKRPKSCFILKETKKTWQVSMIHDPDQNTFVVVIKDTHRPSEEILINL